MQDDRCWDIHKAHSNSSASHCTHPIKLARGIMNCATNSDATGATLNFNDGNPGTLCVSKHTSEKNGIGQVGCVRSIVLTTIHANRTAL